MAQRRTLTATPSQVQLLVLLVLLVVAVARSSLVAAAVTISSAAATTAAAATASGAARAIASDTLATTPSPAAPPAPLDLSGFEDVADRAAPIVGLVVAPVLCFFGLAWYPLVALVLGFLAGGALFALGAFLLVESYSTAAATLMLAAFVSGGVVVGSALRLRPAACSFLVGGAAGVALALVACFVVADVSALARPSFSSSSSLSSSSSSSLSGVAVLIVSSTSLLLFVLVGTLFVRFERPAAIAWTSVAGAYWWLSGVGYFAGAFPTWRAVYDHARGGGPAESDKSANGSDGTGDVGGHDDDTVPWQCAGASACGRVASSTAAEADEDMEADALEEVRSPVADGGDDGVRSAPFHRV
ncbi:hypothetical protein PybrP1_012808 [[Pythium] brassicae (nom. inval.)]|nr:hypothetical protein PybrP1_012808 [[Pythium] brassicae (nom. inval.)]